MYFKKNIVTGILLIFSALTASSQTRAVFGQVTAFGGNPVQNVEVTSKKAGSATLTDSLGQFNLICLKEDVVRVRSKTFRNVTRRVGLETDSLSFELEFLDTRRNREIAVGYGYLSEEDLTAAISTLEQEKNNFCHYQDVFDLIIGRFPGVSVENGQVIIRGHKSLMGSDEALYVVNGVVVTSINWIQPCDIESISVIKDGSAAVYGSRGANGVVQIETKRAKINQ